MHLTHAFNIRFQSERLIAGSAKTERDIVHRNVIFAEKAFLAVCIFLLAVLGSAASAQEAEDSLVSRWNDRSVEARQALKSDQDGTVAERIDSLEEIRTGIAAQRDRALALSRDDPFEAQIVQGKLTLLGKPPEEGESEFAAAKRAELEERLYELRAPQRAMEDSYLRSVATIALLDDEIERLKNQQLLRRGQTPLAPGSWITFAQQASQKLSDPSATQGAQPGPEIGDRTIVTLIALAAALLGIAIATIGRRRASVSFEKRYDPQHARPRLRR